MMETSVACKNIRQAFGKELGKRVWSAEFKTAELSRQAFKKKKGVVSGCDKSRKGCGHFCFCVRKKTKICEPTARDRRERREGSWICNIYNV